MNFEVISVWLGGAGMFLGYLLNVASHSGWIG